MKYLKYLLLIQALIFLTNCDKNSDVEEGGDIAGKKISYVTYNDSIVALHDNFIDALDDFNIQSGSLNDSIFTDAINLYKNNLDSIILKMQGLGAFDGDDSFIRTGIKLFKYHRGLADNSYPELRNLQNKITESEDFKEKMKLRLEKDSISNIIKSQDKKLRDKFINAQRKLAAKYNTELK